MHSVVMLLLAAGFVACVSTVHRSESAPSAPTRSLTSLDDAVLQSGRAQHRCHATLESRLHTLQSIVYSKVPSGVQHGGFSDCADVAEATVGTDGSSAHEGAQPDAHGSLGCKRADGSYKLYCSALSSVVYSYAVPVGHPLPFCVDVSSLLSAASAVHSQLLGLRALVHARTIPFTLQHWIKQNIPVQLSLVWAAAEVSLTALSSSSRSEEVLAVLQYACVLTSCEDGLPNFLGSLFAFEDSGSAGGGVDAASLAPCGSWSEFFAHTLSLEPPCATPFAAPAGRGSDVTDESGAIPPSSAEEDEDADAATTGDEVIASHSTGSGDAVDVSVHEGWNRGNGIADASAHVVSHYNDVVGWLEQHLFEMHTLSRGCVHTSRAASPAGGVGSAELSDAIAFAVSGLTRFITLEGESFVMMAAQDMRIHACVDLDGSGAIPFYVNATAVSQARSAWKARQDQLPAMIDDDSHRTGSSDSRPFISLSTLSTATPAPPADTLALARWEAIRRAIGHAWGGYRKYAFGSDILKPLSRVGEGDLCKMAMTLIDSLDTLLVAGAVPEYMEARAWLAANFTLGGQRNINLFETTIRVVGGLLAAHSMTNDALMLRQARSVMDAMIDTGAFATATGLPYGTLTIYDRTAAATIDSISGDDGGDGGGGGGSEGQVDLPGPGVQTPLGYAYNPSWDSGASSISEVTTLQVELLALSALTGNTSYADLSHRIMRVIDVSMPPDGLFPIYIEPQSGKLRDAVITLGARGDSLYEYLLKQWVLLGGWNREREVQTALSRYALRLVLHQQSFLLFGLVTSTAGDAAGSFISSLPNDSSAAAVPSHAAGGANPVDVVKALCAHASEFVTSPYNSQGVTSIELTAMCRWLQLESAVGDTREPIARLAATASLDSNRYLLTMYNRAMCGITDRLLRASRTDYWYIVEQLRSVLAMGEGESPPTSPKMDHLVCFLPGTIALGLLHGAGHASMAWQQEGAIQQQAAQAAVAELNQQVGGLEPILDAWMSLIGRLGSEKFAGVTLPPDWQSELIDNVMHAATAIRAKVPTVFAGDLSVLPMPTFLLSHTSTMPQTPAGVDDTTWQCSAHIPQMLGIDTCFCGIRDPSVARTTLLAIAEKLSLTCAAMYTTTSTGLAPEIVTFNEYARDGEPDFKPNHDARHSLLRPETVESLFILYRLTGKQRYRDLGWRIFTSMEAHAKVRTGGYASVRDVDIGMDTGVHSRPTGNQHDKMESFAVAETFKYLLLLFSDVKAGTESGTEATTASLLDSADTRVDCAIGGRTERSAINIDTMHQHGGSDGSALDLTAWVYNTEAHPVRVLTHRMSEMVQQLEALQGEGAATSDESKSKSEVTMRGNTDS